MNFIYPAFLFALLALCIPIIIHLFNFRRFKKVYFTNVRFLKEVKEETASRSKLKHWLVLASRLLAITFLVLAFAQPFIPVKNDKVNKGSKGISVYVDNSFSMNASTKDQSLIELAKKRAREIANSYDETDRFNILTNDFEGRHQRMISKEEFLSFVDEIKLSPSVRYMKDLLNRQNEALEKENIENKIVYLISDFQKSIADFENDTALSINLVPLQAVNQRNLYIDSTWFDAPIQLLNQPTRLIVKIRNTGDEPVENYRISLKINDQMKAISDFSIAAGSYAYDTLNFTITQAAWNNAELAINDYPITFDDTYFAAFKVAEKVNILTIYERKSNPFLDALYQGDDLFSYNSLAVNELDYSKFSAYQLVILNNLNSVSSGLAAELIKYLERGGSLVIFPGTEVNPSNFNSFLSMIDANTIIDKTTQQKEIAAINVEQEVFNDVFEEIPQNINLPTAKKSYQFTSRTRTREEPVLTFKDGSSMLSRYSFQSGNIYLFAVPLDQTYSDLPVHAIFVPMMVKMAILGTKSSHIAYTIGENTRIEINNELSSADKVYKIVGNDIEFIPEQITIGSKILLGLKNQVNKSGIYRIFQEDDEFTSLLALNYNRKESQLEYLSTEEMSDKFTYSNVTIIDAKEGSIGQIVSELDKGVVLWKLCIILALIFLAIEILLLRFLPS